MLFFAIKFITSTLLSFDRVNINIYIKHALVHLKDFKTIKHFVDPGMDLECCESVQLKMGVIIMGNFLIFMSILFLITIWLIFVQICYNWLSIFILSQFLQVNNLYHPNLLFIRSINDTARRLFDHRLRFVILFFPKLNEDLHKDVITDCLGVLFFAASIFILTNELAVIRVFLNNVFFYNCKECVLFHFVYIECNSEKFTLKLCHSLN